MDSTDSCGRPLAIKVTDRFSPIRASPSNLRVLLLSQAHDTASVVPHADTSTSILLTGRQARVFNFGSSSYTDVMPRLGRTISSALCCAELFRREIAGHRTQ